MISPLTTLRRTGAQLAVPLEFCARMDGRIGVFSRTRLLHCQTTSTTTTSGGVLRVPLHSAISGSRQRVFTPAPALWRSAASLASTIYVPAYFEVTGNDPDETQDQHEQQMRHAAPGIHQRKEVEAAAALFIASCLVTVQQQNKKNNINSNSKLPIVSQTAWIYNDAHHIPVSPLGNTAESIEEVHARFRVFQSRALLEACLMDAVTSAEPRIARDLFGETAAVPQNLSNVITKAVEIVTSGAVFNASGRCYFAPFLSSVCTAVSPGQANCVIVRRGQWLVLELVRDVRAGEELCVAAFKLPDGSIAPVLYNQMFSDAPTYGFGTDYCVTTANEREPYLSGVAGCIPPSFIETTRLEHLDVAAWSAAATQGAGSATATADALVESGAPQLERLRDRAGMLVVDGSKLNTNTNFSSTVSTQLTCSFVLEVARVLQAPPYYLQLRGLIFSYAAKFNIDRTKIGQQHLSCPFEGIAAKSPLESQSPYRDVGPVPWTTPVTTTSQNSNNVKRVNSTAGLLWQVLDMTLLFITTSDTNEVGQRFFDSIRKKADFNAVQLREQDSVATEFVIQTNAAMNYVYNTPWPPGRDTTVGSGATCVERGTCLPIGGFSVWASTRQHELPRFDVAERSAQAALGLLSSNPSSASYSSSPPLTPRNRRSIAVILPSSSTALFHENVPAANGAASSIVAGLALADTLTSSPSVRQLLRLHVPLDANRSATDGTQSTAWEPTQVHFLFAVADEYGLSGTGRYVAELLTLNCSRTLDENETARIGAACASPLYAKLNFTATDLAEYTHVFSLEQLLVGDDIFVHSDEVRTRATQEPPASLLQQGVVSRGGAFNFSGSAAQRKAKDFFLVNSAARSVPGGTQLPPNGLFAFFEPVSSKNALLATNASYRVAVASAFDRRWSGQYNETVLLTLSGYGDRYSDPMFQSSGDVAWRGSEEALNTTLIRKAVGALASFLVDLWTSELADFASSGMAANLTRDVPASLLAPGGISVNPVNDTFVADAFACIAARDATACLRLSTVPTPSFYPGVFQGPTSKPALAQRIVRVYMDHFLSRLDMMSDDSNPTATAAAALSCPCSGFSQVCGLQNLCIEQRAFYVHAFAPMVQYASVGFVNTTPSADMALRLPAALINAPLWTESFWRGLEARVAQRQLYDAGPLLGVAIALTVLTCGATWGISNFVFE